MSTTASRRAGYVTLLGAPNVGKSSLMNALLGEALSSVTARPQTTWRRVTGLLTTEAEQFIFLDTPGLLEPKGLLHRSLVKQAMEALREADVLLLILDPLDPARPGVRERLVQALAEVRAPLVVVVNKCDEASEEAVAREEAWAREVAGVQGVERVSARTGVGLDRLLERIAPLLPESPFLYPADDLAIDSVRFFVAERVREALLENYSEEVPYAVFAEVDEFREAEPKTFIRVVLYAERASQKGILIGHQGAAIRALGASARAKIEHFLGGEVYLELWVKVLPGWRKKRAHLRRFGFSVPEDDAPS
jgi:GTPase